MIPCQRHLFDMPDDVAYLNCAYMSPLMHSVVEAVREGAARKARPWTVSPQDFFTDTERARDLFAQLIGATADDVAVVPAASYGISTAARNLPVKPGQKILLLADQFPSNVYGWRELAKASGAEVVTLNRAQDDNWTLTLLDAIDENTSIAALANNHWTDGSLIDLVAVGARLREVGAALVLDLTQSLGALPFSVVDVQPDFMVAASYKWLMGPYSIGFMYVAPKWQDGEPLEHSWIARRRSEDFANLLDYQDDFQPGARRFDVGERSNFALMPGAIASMEALLEWTPEAVSATLGARNNAIADQAADLGLTAPPPDSRAPHFLGLKFPGALPDGLVATLAARHIHVSVRGTSMRVTSHVYNNDDDVARLIQALAELV